MAGFLAIKPSYAPAHKLMGQIYENLGDTKKAIAAYKLSLELDSSQKDILLISMPNCFNEFKVQRLYFHTESHNQDFEHLGMFVKYIMSCSSNKY